MAEINDAYAALIRNIDAEVAASGPAVDMGDGPRRRGRATATASQPTGHRPRRHHRDVPAAQPDDTPRPGRTPPEDRDRPRGQPPLRAERRRHEELRASTPTGPMERARIRNFRRPKPPRLDRARDHVIEFGKFHGHTLGQIAAFEPSYIDWVASTVTRDPDLVAAARVVQADLDARGVARRSHPTPTRATQSA